MKQISLSVDIALALPYDPTVIALCAEQQAELEKRYEGGDEAPTGLDPQVEFLVARISREPVGCAGLLISRTYGEVTRMYVRPAHRGHGVSRMLLASIEDLARKHSLRTLRLETGDLQPESIGLYQSSGYRRIPAFGRYVGSPLSLCFEKHI